MAIAIQTPYDNDVLSHIVQIEMMLLKPPNRDVKDEATWWPLGNKKNVSSHFSIFPKIFQNN